jgi:hypothetical protein
MVERKGVGKKTSGVSPEPMGQRVECRLERGQN